MIHSFQIQAENDARNNTGNWPSTFHAINITQMIYSVLSLSSQMTEYVVKELDLLFGRFLCMQMNWINE